MAITQGRFPCPVMSFALFSVFSFNFLDSLENLVFLPSLRVN